ncbi:MAG: hypothetical protein PVSMB4_04610 [Ktedonobacterales bacterium]
MPIKRPKLLVTALACISVLLACTSTTVVSSTAPSPTPAASATPVVATGPQPCGPGLSAVDWSTVIPGFDARSQRVEPAICADLKRNGHQEAVVPVRYDGTGAILDFYVYAPSGGAPTLLFSQAGASGSLYKGTVAVSTQSTIIAGEVDAGSCINRATTSNAALIRDLYREWQWNGSAFVQEAFPGIFPAFTRYQAELYQQSVVDTGGAPWALDPVQLTNTFATQWLSAGPTPGATLVTNSGAFAQTRVMNFSVNVERLLYADHGMWEITGIAAQPAMSATTPAEGTAVTSPIALGGTGYSFEAGNFQTALWDKVNVATASVDHCVLGSGSVHSGASSAPAAAFSGSLTYTADSHTVDEALLWLGEQSARGDGSWASLQLIKVLAG